MSGTSQQPKSVVSCGKDLDHAIDLPTELHKATNTGFDFVCYPLFHPRFERDPSQSKISRVGPLTRSDLLLSSSEWTSLVVGKFSPWIDLDSDVSDVRARSEAAFSEETDFAMHLSVPALLIDLKSESCVNLARHINSLLQNRSLSAIWLRVPMVLPACEGATSDDTSAGAGDSTSTWHWWNMVRTMCGNHRKLSLALELPAEPPADSIVKRWLGEPIKAAIFSTDIFMPNHKGFPVLSKELQTLYYCLLDVKAQFILTGKGGLGKSIEIFWQYLNHLYQMTSMLNQIETFAKGYEDYLQAPLQPLKDNLDSQTYEVFERDSTKYKLYEEAIVLALMDRVSKENTATIVTTIMVVGAGRGPLVEASLRASQRTGRKIRVYAVEKNTNAIITLKNLQLEKWGSSVTVICKDMREWEAPELADILVSELLGSFGDNELSPECLDGAQRFLKPDAISIPCSYTSYVAPTSSPRLHVDVGQHAEQGRSPEVPFETGYVVFQKNYHRIAEAKPCFTFVHPNRIAPIDNERLARLSFDVDQDSVLHGFNGYFEAVLYKDVLMSIVPATHTPNMFSWFSIFFPIRTPMHLHAGQTLEICIWRKVNSRNVWYEWCVTRPVGCPIHNPNGRSYSLGLH